MSGSTYLTYISTAGQIATRSCEINVGIETPYRRVTGNVFDGMIIEASDVSFHAIDVEILAWSRLAILAARDTSMNSCSPVTVDFELRVANAIIHNNNVGARNDRVGITGLKELAGIDDSQSRKGRGEEL